MAMSSAPERTLRRAAVPNRVYQARVAAARHSWIRQHSDVGSELPVWTSRGGWIEELRKWSISSDFRRIRAELNVSITGATLVAIAAVWATFADHDTGRNAAVTRARIAAMIGCNPKTITRAWKVLAAGRFAVEVYHGHGSAQAPGYGKRPSIWHLVSRAPVNADVVENVPLPPLGGCSSESPVGTDSPRVRERTKTRICRSGSGRRSRATPRPLDVQRFAGQFVAQTHGLGQGHIGHICDAFMASQIDINSWTVRQLRRALDDDMRAMGWNWPDEITNPAGFLLSRLRRLPARPNKAGQDLPGSPGGTSAAAPNSLPAELPAVSFVWPQPRPGHDADSCARCGAPGAQDRPFLPAHKARLCQPCWEL